VPIRPKPKSHVTTKLSAKAHIITNGGGQLHLLVLWGATEGDWEHLSTTSRQQSRILPVGELVLRLGEVLAFQP